MFIISSQKIDIYLNSLDTHNFCCSSEFLGFNEDIVMEQIHINNWKQIIYTIAAIQVGTGVTIIGVLSFIPLFLVELGLSDAGEAAFWAGLVSGITPMMVSFSAPYWTRKAEEFGARKILTLILGLITIVTFACFFVKNPCQLFILRMTQGLMGGFVPVCASLTVKFTPKERMTWGLGIFQAANVMGIMFGPVIGGVVADLFGYRVLFLVFGLLALCSLIGTLLFIPNVKAEKKPKESILQSIFYFLENPTVRLMIFLQFLCNFAMTGIGPILPLYIRSMMGIDTHIVATVVGIIVFIAGGASAMASMYVSKLTVRYPMYKILMTSTLLCGIFFVLQYMMSTVWELGLFRALTGMSMGLVMPIANTVITLAVPEERRGTVFGVTTSLSLWGNVVGPVFTGVLAMQCGYGSVFWSTAFIFIFATILIKIQRERIVIDDRKRI